MSGRDRLAGTASDWTRQPLGALSWWGLPILIGVGANFFTLTRPETAGLWAGLFAWMGAGCILNAWRCGRRHCFISGPALWVGAVGAALVGLKRLSGPHVLEEVVWATVVLVVVSFVPEAVWGKYTHSA